MTFEDAKAILKEGHSVWRKAWNGRAYLKTILEFSKDGTKTYVLRKVTSHHDKKYRFAKHDRLATDWEMKQPL